MPSTRTRPPSRATLLVVGALAVAVALVGAYLALGGGRYTPSAVADPCGASWPAGKPRNADEAGQRVARLALAQAACRLGSTREDLLLALASRDALTRFETSRGLDHARVEAAVRDGIDGALAQATRAGAIDAGLATVIGQAARVLPLDRAVRTIDGTAAPCEPLPWQPAGSDETVLAEVVVQGLVRTACTLDTPALDVLQTLVQADGVAALARASGKTPAAVEQAVSDALRASLGDAVAAGDLTPDVGTALDALVQAAPVDRALGVLRGDRSSCEAIAWRPELSSTTQVAAQVGLRAITGTSCALGVPVAEVATAVAKPDGLAGLAAAHGLDPAHVEEVARGSLRDGLKAAEASGAVTGVLARALDAAVEVVPVDRLLATLRGDDDPCVPLAWKRTDGTTQVAAEIVLVGITQAACTLHTSTAKLAGALASDADLDAYAQGVPGGRDAVDHALRDGLHAGVDQAQSAGDLNTVAAFILRQAVDNTPLLSVIGAVRG